MVGGGGGCVHVHVGGSMCVYVCVSVQYDVCVPFYACYVCVCDECV